MKNNKVLITGGAGFIGGHLVNELLEEGYNVTVIDNMSTGSYDNIIKYADNSRYKYAIADIQNEAVLDRLVSESDAIIHLAAAVGVSLIVESPVRTIETNVLGTEVLLRTALRYRVKVVLASTSEVYGKGNGIPFKEDDDVLIGPTSRSRWAYSASKMVDEFLGLAYSREYGLPVVVARLFNTVGAGQSGRYGMVIPRFVESAIGNLPITVYGDGSQQRCFCDVRDVVGALRQLVIQPKAVGRVFNVGSTNEISISALALKIKQLCGSNSIICNIPYDQAYAPGFEDMMRRVPSIDRIGDLCGWHPTIALDKTIEDVRDYYVNRLSVEPGN